MSDDPSALRPHDREPTKQQSDSSTEAHRIDLPLENVTFTNMVMNSAAGHFDEHVIKSHPAGKRVVYGGVTIGIVAGLAMQDTGENAIRELGLDGIRLTKSVFHGDTLYALTEVLETKESHRDDAGEVVFRHYGINQNDELVFHGDRRVLIKKRSAWLDR